MKSVRMKYFLILLTFLFGFISVKPVLASEKPIITSVFVLPNDGTLQVNGSNFTNTVFGSIEIISSGVVRNFSLTALHDNSTVIFTSIKDIWDPDTVPLGGEVEIVIINNDGVSSDRYSGLVYYIPEINSDEWNKVLVPGQPFSLSGKRFGNNPSLLFSRKDGTFFQLSCNDCTRNTTTISLPTANIDPNLFNNVFFVQVKASPVLNSLKVPITVAKKPEITDVTVGSLGSLRIEGKNFGKNVEVIVKIPGGSERKYFANSVLTSPTNDRLVIQGFYEFYNPDSFNPGGENLTVTVNNVGEISSDPFSSNVVFGPYIDQTRTSQYLYLDSPFTVYGKRFGQSSEGKGIDLGKYSSNSSDLYTCSQFASCAWTNNSITLQDRNLFVNKDNLFVITGQGDTGQSNKHNFTVLTGTPEVTTTLSTTPSVTVLTADFNKDGVVDDADLTKLKQCYVPFARASISCQMADLDNNGYVGAMDYSLLLTQAGR